MYDDDVTMSSFLFPLTVQTRFRIIRPKSALPFWTRTIAIIITRHVFRYFWRRKKNVRICRLRKHTRTHYISIRQNIDDTRSSRFSPKRRYALSIYRVYPHKRVDIKYAVTISRSIPYVVAPSNACTSRIRIG